MVTLRVVKRTGHGALLWQIFTALPMAGAGFNRLVQRGSLQLAIWWRLQITFAISATLQAVVWTSSALSMEVVAMSDRSVAGTTDQIADDTEDWMPLLSMQALPEPRVMDGEIWQEFADAVRRMSHVVDRAPSDPLSRAAGFRYLARYIAAGVRLCIEYGDPYYPELVRMVDCTMPWGNDNPDCLYLYTQLPGANPAGGGPRYRISGYLGTATDFDIQIVRGHYSDGRPRGWELVSELNTDSLSVAANGNVEIVISPDEQPGNWLRLGTGLQFLQIRQYTGDWERENPADLIIERTDAPYPPPATDSTTVADQLDLLKQWISTGLRQWETMARKIMNLPANTTIQPAAPSAGVGHVGQSYGDGHFVCEPEKAVILEVRPPKCRYWSVVLCDPFWESIDFATRQSSLNHTQARPDTDGVVRMILAHVDPGVPNWLDVGGHREGTIAVRYFAAESRPPVEAKAVKLAELRNHLPADTPEVSPAERAERLAARRRAAWRRYRR